MGLIHPGILAGFLAVAAPIAIHFIRSQKYQRVSMGSLRFLRIAVHERRRWRRVEDWPLLLARIAAILALTLLFARPFLPEREKVPPSDLEVILLVDVSGSLSGPHFEAVRAAARETIAKIPHEAKVTVAEFADDVRVVDGGMLEALHALPGAKTDYVRAVNWTLDHIAQSDRKNAQVYLISDLQRAALPSTAPRVWPSNTRVSVVPVAPAGQWNTAISKVELLTPFANEEAVAEVTFALSGEVPDAKREVELAIDGQTPMKQTINAGTIRTQFHWKPEKEGAVRGMATVASDDAFPEDNRRPFVIRLARPKRVLLVESGNPLTPYDGQSYNFLEKALAVSGREGALSPFDSLVQEDLTGLDGVDAVAWCNAPAPASDVVAQLQDFVTRGGAVAFFLGSETKPADFAALAGSGLFPGKIEPIETPVLRGILEWDHSHGALRRFDGGDRGDLRSILLRDAFEIEGGPEWTTLARLENGHPALLSRELGKGRVLVFANPLTRAWTDFPTQRIFLPLMKEWFSWLTRFDPEGNAPRALSPGLNESRPIGIYEKPKAIEDLVQAQADIEKWKGVWKSDHPKMQALQAKVDSLQRAVGATDQNAQPFKGDGILEVVAPDPAEMDVTVADAAFARRALGLPGEEAAAVAGENTRLPRSRERQNELWPSIALALLGLLIYENFIADQRSKAREHVT